MQLHRVVTAPGDLRSRRAARAALLPAALMLVLCCTASAAKGQTVVSTEPPSPTAGIPVTLVLYMPYGCPGFLPPAVRNGFTVDVPLGSCLAAGLPATATFELGPLEAGTYTVRQFSDDPPLPPNYEVIGEFIVGEGVPVPALGGWAAATLAILLALTAVRRLQGG